ncbi:42134_t:CDS:2, partial [Gigaspora margarita]
LHWINTSGYCDRCSRDKLIPKRFSQENDMDLEEVPAELPRLNQVEEMLISQVLPMLTVFNLQGGQLGYLQLGTMSMSNNITKLKNLNQPVAKVKAVHSGPGARNASLEVTN